MRVRVHVCVKQSADWYYEQVSACETILRIAAATGGVLRAIKR